MGCAKCLGSALPSVLENRPEDQHECNPSDAHYDNDLRCY
jgi:hypothetical protein